MGRFLILYIKCKEEKWADNYIDYSSIKAEITKLVEKIMKIQEKLEMSKLLHDTTNKDGETFEEEEIYNTSYNASIDFNNLSVVSNPIDLFQASTMSDNELRRGQLNTFIDILRSEINKVYQFMLDKEHNLSEKYIASIKEPSIDYKMNDYVDLYKKLGELAKDMQSLSFYVYMNIFALSKIMEHLTKKLKGNIANTTYSYLHNNLEECNNKLFYMFQFKLIDHISILLEKQNISLLQTINRMPLNINKDNLLKEDVKKYSTGIRKTLDKINDDYINYEECLMNYSTSLQIDNINDKIQEYLHSDSHGNSNDINLNRNNDLHKTSFFLILFFHVYYMFCYTSIIISNLKAIEIVIHLGISYTGCVLYLAPAGCFVSLFFPKVFHNNSFKIPIILSIIILLLSHSLYIVSIAYKNLILMMLSRFCLGLGSNYLFNQRYFDQLKPFTKRNDYQTNAWTASMIGITIGFIINIFTPTFPFIDNNTEYMTSYQINSYISLLAGTSLLLLICYAFRNPSDSIGNNSIINISNYSHPLIVLDETHAESNQKDDFFLIKEKAHLLLKQENSRNYSQYMKCYIIFQLISLSIKLAIEALFVFSAFYYVDNNSYLNEASISILFGVTAFLSMCVTFVGKSFIKSNHRIPILILLIISIIASIGLLVDFILNHLKTNQTKIIYTIGLGVLLISASFLDLLTYHLSVKLIPQHYLFCSTQWSQLITYFSILIQIIPGLLIGFQCIFWIPASLIGIIIFGLVLVLFISSFILFIVFYEQIKSTSIIRLMKSNL